MIIQLFAATLLAAVGVTASGCRVLPPCIYDDCGKALNTNPQGRVDCASYFRTTVTEPVATITETTVVTTGTVAWSVSILPVNTTLRSVEPRGVPAATACVTEIPTYAAVCDNASRYASACSCVGATRTTITVGGGSKTVTVTSRTTETTHVSATARPFIMVVDDTHYFTPVFDGGFWTVTLTTDRSLALPFYIEPSTTSTSGFLHAIGFPQVASWDRFNNFAGTSAVYLAGTPQDEEHLGPGVGAEPFECSILDLDLTGQIVCAAGMYTEWATTGMGSDHYTSIVITDDLEAPPPDGMRVTVMAQYVG
ncbi:hypothetical protein AA313_de0205708 [Arthrobotrys entomopaga]|nr:hypothetical protein AA313_de0205708 [Arthrobotrys entomopaga]